MLIDIGRPAIEEIDRSSDRAAIIFDLIRAFYPGFKSNINIMITLSCPFGCEHCAVKEIMKGSVSTYMPDMPENLWRKIIEEAKGLSSVLLTGGEPFAHPQIMQILRFACSLIPKVYVDTNAFYFTQDENALEKLFDELPENIILVISIDDFHIDNWKKGEKSLPVIVKLAEDYVRRKGRLDIEYNIRTKNYNYKEGRDREAEALIRYCGLSDKFKSCPEKFHINRIIRQGAAAERLREGDTLELDRHDIWSHNDPNNLFLFIGVDDRVATCDHVAYMRNPESEFILGNAATDSIYKIMLTYIARYLRYYPEDLKGIFLKSLWEYSFVPQVKGWGDFYPKEIVAIGKEIETPEVYFTLDLDRLVANPKENILAQVFYSGTYPWGEVRMELVNDYGNGSYRFKGVLPRGFTGAYVFAYHLVDQFEPKWRLWTSDWKFANHGPDDNRFFETPVSKPAHSLKATTFPPPEISDPKNHKPIAHILQEWYKDSLNAAEFIAELSHLLQIENILDQDKSTFIFSEKVTFDNGLGVLLPKLAKSGMRVAVIATNDRQRALIDELNQDKPENERIFYADTVADVRTKIHTARYYYFKVSGDPDTDLQGITTFDITVIVKKIIDALGKVSGIIERERLELLHEAARKFAEAA